MCSKFLLVCIFTAAAWHRGDAFGPLAPLYPHHAPRTACTTWCYGRMLHSLQMAEQHLNDCMQPQTTPPTLRPVSRPSGSGSKSLKRKFLTGAAALSVSFVTPLPSRAVDVQAGYIATHTHRLFFCIHEYRESLCDARMNLACCSRCCRCELRAEGIAGQRKTHRSVGQASI